MSGLTPPERKTPTRKIVGSIMLILGMCGLLATWCLFLWCLYGGGNLYDLSIFKLMIYLAIVSIVLFIIGLGIVLLKEQENSQSPDEPGEE